ncbi:hypothetical protein SLOPH_2378 [Spraguea lophii 42_110]|uniref:SMP-LTD domain-containing protein n=1 Tax=Spraguea lophii (strain 42_110) TaxID=1358809 RepID=S7XLV1_SPRLO|nr:hypothetical protein SLOPH_2378 [Spraguea lophii 42_110]
MFLLLIVGFILGIFSTLIIVELGLRLLIAFSRRKPVKPQDTKTVVITATQKNLINQALHKCTDVGWFNVFFQRFWIELARSDAHIDRMKRMLLGKFRIYLRKKILDEVNILNIKIGSEAPVIKSIQLLNKEELSELIKNRKKEIEREIQEDNDISEVEKMINEPKNNDKNEISTNGIESYSIRGEETFYDEIENDDFYKDIFDKAVFLIDVEYNGEIITEIATKVKGFKITTEVKFSNLSGQLLLKIPAEHHYTRLEVSFLQCNKPTITPFVNKNTYFSSTISKLLKKLLYYIFKRQIVYPNWHPLRLPLVVPSIREISHDLEILTSTNCHEIKKNLVNNLKLYVSMDYKIHKNKKGIMERINNIPVNITGELFWYHFPLPDKFDNNILYNFKLLEPLREIWHIKKIEESKIVEGGVYLISVIIGDTSIEFLRIHVDDMLIFQRNDLKNKDFIIFSVKNGNLNIHTYITDNLYKLNLNEIEILKDEVFKIKKIGKREFDIEEVKNIFLNMRNNYMEKPESDKFIFKKLTLPLEKNELIGIINKRETRMKLVTSTGRVINENKLVVEIEEFTNKDSIEQKEINEENEKINLKQRGNNSPYLNETDNTNEIILKKGNKIDKEENPVETVEIRKRHIEYFDWETKDSNTGNSIIGGSVVYRIFTYKENGIIIDAEFDKINFLTIFKITEVENGTELEIYYTPTLAAIYEFTSYLVLNTRILQCKRIEKNGISFNCKNKIELQVECQGGICLEISTNEIDDFYLTLYNKKTKKYILSDFKIVTSSPAFFAFGIKESAMIKIILKPKFYTDKSVTVDIRKLNNTYSDDYIINCDSSLPQGKKKLASFKGKKGSRVFWNIDYDDDIISFLENEEGKRDNINGYGVISSLDTKYYFYSKNRGIKKRSFKICMGMLPVQL